jgi:threonine dehydrogenase-like Zn-dependent dehydrogenase
MKAVHLLGEGRSEVRAAEMPEPGSEEVLLSIEGCGICASSLPAWEGRQWFDYPLEAGAPGHEPWGRVVRCGTAVAGLEPGMPVTGLSYRAYAEFDVARADELVPLPASLESKPFPGEALACAMNVCRRARIGRDTRVAVVGAGFIGGIVIQVAVAAGARVTAFSRRQWSLDQARNQGAAESRSLADGLGGSDAGAYECVVECTGSQGGLDSASALVGTGGRLVIAGYHQDGDRRVDMQSWNWKGLDVINAHERDPARYLEGTRAALEAIRRREIDVWPLLTHSVCLDQIDRGFELLRSRPEGFTKAILWL